MLKCFASLKSKNIIQLSGSDPKPIKSKETSIMNWRDLDQALNKYLFYFLNYLFLWTIEVMIKILKEWTPKERTRTQKRQTNESAQAVCEKIFCSLINKAPLASSVESKMVDGLTIYSSFSHFSRRQPIIRLCGVCSYRESSFFCHPIYHWKRFFLNNTVHCPKHISTNLMLSLKFQFGNIWLSELFPLFSSRPYQLWLYLTWKKNE